MYLVDCENRAMLFSNATRLELPYEPYSYLVAEHAGGTPAVPPRWFLHTPDAGHRLTVSFGYGEAKEDVVAMVCNLLRRG